MPGKFLIRFEKIKMKLLETEVLIIGGGVTGAGIMRDLALRDIHCLLIDRQDLSVLVHQGAIMVCFTPVRDMFPTISRPLSSVARKANS